MRASGVTSLSKEKRRKRDETHFLAIGRVNILSDSDRRRAIIGRLGFVFFFGRRLRRIGFAIPEVRKRVREVLVAMSVRPGTAGNYKRGKTGRSVHI